MAVATIVTGVPWKQLILLIPDVSKAAKALWEQWTKAKPEPIDPTAPTNAQITAISRRIEALEANEPRQSKIVSDIADQLQAIAVGLGETAARQARATALASTALALSLCSLALAVFFAWQRYA
jgi:hypothetical protein